MRPGQFLLLASLLLMALTSACEQQPPARATSQPATATAPDTAELANLRDFVRESTPRPGMNLPPGHPAIGETGSAAVGTAQPAAPDRLKYTVPDQWVEIPVRSALRSAQYRLPRAAGDSEDGEMAIFSPGIGGDVEANIARWRGQFTAPDGGPLPDEAAIRQTMQVNGLQVTLLDVAGRYNPGAGMMMGGSAPAIKEHYRMFAVIVETPGGPRFIKAVGPQETMSQHRAAFLDFVRSLRLE